MRFLKLLWSRYTLLCILVLTSVPLTLLGWAGKKTVYGGYDYSPAREPLLSLVFEGIHDEVYPWEMIFPKKAEEGETEEDKEGSAAGETAAEGATASGDAEAGAAATTDPAGDGDKEAGAGGKSDDAADTAGKDTAEVTAKDKDAAADKTSKEDGNEAQDTLPEDADDSGPVEEIETLPSNAIHGDPEVIPEGVCNPVMQAEDYDVVNVAFLSPDDTEYNTDTEGIFAKNGIYYKLQAVDMSYFSDALFIGDSRTVGLCEYGSLKETAAFLAKESINVYNVLDKELWYTDFDGEGWDSTVEDALERETYGKVYVALGVNELGIGTTYMYYEKYRELIELVREYQPDAIIYIQGIMHVSYAKSSSDSCRNNTVISQRNYAISTLANGRDIFYIDMNPYVCDESGDLYEDYSGDGIHLKASAYEYWDKSLLENAIVYEYD